MAFNQTDVEKKPILACIGYVSNVGALKAPKEGGTYYSIPLEITAQGTGFNMKTQLSFLPDFFEPGFAAGRSALETRYGKDKAFAVEWSYKRNVVNRDCTALLQGICGDEETFAKFGALVDGLADTAPETIYAAVRDFLGELGPVSFGYILRQPMKKTGDVDDEGKAIKERSVFYDIDAFFRLTQDNLKKVVKRAERNKEARKDAIASGGDVPEEFRLKFEPADYLG